MTEKPEPTVESLHTQLQILNERSRWYASQMWHMPFAYFGITGVALGMADSSAVDPAWLSIILGGLGLVVFVCMFGLQCGAKRAVRGMKGIEESLDLDKTVVWVSWYTPPIFVAVIAVAGVLLVFGLRGVLVPAT